MRLLLLLFDNDQILYLVNPDHELASAALWQWSNLVPGESRTWASCCCILTMIKTCTLLIPNMSLLLLLFNYDQILNLMNPEHELASSALWQWSNLLTGESRPWACFLLLFDNDQILHLVNPDHELAFTALWLWSNLVPGEYRPWACFCCSLSAYISHFGFK